MEGCLAYRRTEIVVATLLGLLATVAAVIGSVTYHQCTLNGWIDYWLMFHGVITVGALVGIMVWRLAPIPGKYINALVYLTGFLIFLNLGWLLLGNVQIGLAYSICYAGNSPDVYLNIPLDCSSKLLPFMLSVAVISDIFYVILLAMFCAQSFYWNHEPEEDTKETVPYLNRWCIAVVVTIAFLIVSVIAIAVGATYLQDCYYEEWGAIWLIVYGVSKIAITIFAFFWIRYRKEASEMWGSHACYLLLPFLVFYFLQLAVLGSVKPRLFDIREENCNGIAACSDVLQVTMIVIISIFLFSAVVTFYYGVIFFFVVLFFFVVTMSYYCSGDSEGDENEVKAIKEHDVLHRFR
ncbi:uncharacterized protein LOC135107218 isoform X2 [Scylla paramamosain]|uniref:uncharacterized protein LOC135107218 isoform X2 n=1 Tax=Scylla paramamosain TaxID=85552 RepID=UPI0030829C01